MSQKKTPYKMSKVGDKVNKPIPKDARDFIDKPYLRPHDLMGKARNVRILKMEWVKSFDVYEKRFNDRMALFFVSKNGEPTKYLELNSMLLIDQIAIKGDDENGAGLGYDPEKWVGKVICIYPAKEKYGKKFWDVIRVRKENKDLLDAQPMPESRKPKDISKKDVKNETTNRG